MLAGIGGGEESDASTGSDGKMARDELQEPGIRVVEVSLHDRRIGAAEPMRNLSGQVTLHTAHAPLRRLESLQATRDDVDEIFIGGVELGAQLAGASFVPA